MPQTINQAAAHLQTSGPQLRSMLQKTGHSLKGYQNADKLDFLEAITEQIRGRLELGQKMALALPEINQVLKTEGIETGNTAKSTVHSLWRLHMLQVARRGDYVTPRKLEDPPQWLAVIPDQVVHDCFTTVPNTSSPQPSPQFTKDNPSPQPCAKHGEVQQSNASALRQPAPTGQLVTIASASNSPTHGEQPVIFSNSADSFKTSVSDLKAMFLKTGLHARLLDGLDKLEILTKIVRQIKDSIKLQRKMQLTISDLNAFTQREGMPQHQNVIEAVTSLLELRRLHLERFANYVVSRHGNDGETEDIQSAASKYAAEDTEFIQGVLMVIPTEKVTECFSHASVRRGQKRQGTDEFGEGERSMSSRRIDESSSLAATQQTAIPPVQSNTVVKMDVEMPEGGLTSATAIPSNSMDAEQPFPKGSIEAEELSPDLQKLLAEFTNMSDSKEALEGWLIADESMDMGQERTRELQAEAAREVDRIIATKGVDGVLVGDNVEEKKRHYRRIAKLLHPDKMIIDANDGRANMALRLAFTANKKLGEN